MLRALNFKTNKTPLWITSDQHFNHDKDFVWGKRGYSSVQESDEGNVSNWNSVVRPNDNVLMLGDFVFRDKDGSLAEQYLARLNGTIYMLWGNHNSGVKPIYQREVRKYLGLDGPQWASAEAPEIYPLRYKNVIFCGDSIYGNIDGVPYVASHFAYHIWNESHHGAIALSGHSHGSDELSNPDCLDCKRLDVGVDNFPVPLSFCEVMRIMVSKKSHQIDHHTPATVSGR